MTLKNIFSLFITIIILGKVKAINLNESDYYKEEDLFNSTFLGESSDSNKNGKEILFEGFGETKTKYLPLVNRGLQVFLLLLILTMATAFNSSIILNISRDALKRRMVHFLLIRHVCIADLIGAWGIITVPLGAVIGGTWSVYPPELCPIISVTTSSIWTMHLFAVASYRMDRLLAVWLPTGRYPLLSVRTLNIIIISVWLVVITVCSLTTFTFGAAYQPTLALCIPNVPLAFFILVFSCYFLGLLGVTTGVIVGFLRKRLKKKRRAVMGETENVIEDGNCSKDDDEKVTQEDGENEEEKKVRRHSISVVISSSNNNNNNHRRCHSDVLRIKNNIVVLSPDSICVEVGVGNNESQQSPEISTENSVNSVQNSNVKQKRKQIFKGPTPHLRFKRKGAMATRALASYSVSMGHLLLYLPAMMVVGLVKGEKLPSGVAVLCGLVVYSEFLVQPLALFFLSPRLRGEIIV